MDEKIYVTQPYLPPLAEFIPYLEKIWESKVLTNGGPFHQQLEEALCRYLGVAHVSLFTNATIALVTALQELRITGEVITTPYSFVATSHCLLWNSIKPVFVDVDPETLNLDPRSIEAAITPPHHRDPGRALLRSSVRRSGDPEDRGHVQPEGHLRRGTRVRRAGVRGEHPQPR